MEGNGKVLEWQILGASDDGLPPLVKRGLHYARQEACLRELIRTKRDAGLITEEDARQIEGVVEEFYKRQGTLTDQNRQHALHSLSETEAMVGVKRQGCYLLERKLLELYPVFENEVKQITGVGPAR